jgi:death-on-curing protein
MPTKIDGIWFLLTQDVIELHDELVAQTSGRLGVRDFGLIDSAVSQPPLNIDGRFVHEDIYGMAAAYLFAVSRNHGFIDAKKRTAAKAVAVFVYMNGYEFDPPEDEWIQLVEQTAQGENSWEDVARFLLLYVR